MIAFENAITPTKLAEFLTQKFHNFSVPVRRAEEKVADKSKRLILEEKTRLLSSVTLLRSVTRNVLINYQNEVKQQGQSLLHQSRFRIKNEKENLFSTGEGIKKETYLYCATQKQNIIQLASNLKKDVNGQLKQTALALDNMERNLTNLNPKNVMKRGYSITLLNGKSVCSYDQVKKGQMLDTILYEGSVQSEVKATKKALRDE